MEKSISAGIGVNGGSLDKRFKNMSEDDALVASALSTADVFEKFGFSNLIVAIKASNVPFFTQKSKKVLLRVPSALPRAK